MRLVILSPAFPFVALAAPAISSTSSVSQGPFQAGVWRIAQGTGIFFFGDAISANAGRFWLGRNTTAYCPGQVENLDCSEYATSSTAFLGGNSTLALDVSVPGGQQVYVAADGALSYTGPHSAAIPDGAVSTGFWREISAAFGAPVNLGYTDRWWQICPEGNVTQGRDGVFQIYLVNQTKEGCYGATMRTYDTSGASAWEYV